MIQCIKYWYLVGILWCWNYDGIRSCIATVNTATVNTGLLWRVIVLIDVNWYIVVVHVLKLIIMIDLCYEPVHCSDDDDDWMEHASIWWREWTSRVHFVVFSRFIVIADIDWGFNMYCV